MSNEFECPVVIDNGRATSKVGFAGDAAPRSIFPSIVAVPNNPFYAIGITDQLVGNEALKYRGRKEFRLRYPIEHGEIINSDEMEKIWYYIFYTQLNVSPEERPVLLTEVPYNSKKNREKMAQIMFEIFNIPALFIANQAVLALYASGRTTGCVIDSGEDTTSVVSVYEGYAILNSTLKSYWGGRDLTDFLMFILSNERGYALRTSVERDYMRDVKEKLCYVSLDYDKDYQMAKESKTFEQSYKLPDGRTITIGNERFKVPEVYFIPSLIGYTNIGIHETVYNSISKCNIDIRQDLYNNIVLAGGSTMFKGFAERLTKELSYYEPVHTKIKVEAPPERKISTWIGGSIFASQSTFLQKCFDKNLYDECGPFIAHSKFL